MVTVLFADLVDSTGLAQRLDAERAREILGFFFEAASEELLALRGRAEKFIGDAVMAVFGLPTVHEDDALRAVRAGLAIRARTRRLSESLGLTTPLDVHVGIESGEAATGLGPAGPAPRHRSRRERRRPPPDRRRTRRGARRRDHRRAHDQRGLVRRPTTGHREGLRRRHHRRLPRADPHAAFGPTDDPVRRALERARDPAREPPPRDQHRTPGARERPRRTRHRQVAPRRRAHRDRGGRRPRARGPRPTVHRHGDVLARRDDRRRARGPGGGRPGREGEAPPPRAGRTLRRARRRQTSRRTALAPVRHVRPEGAGVVRAGRAGRVRRARSTASRATRPPSSCSRTRTSSARRCSS